MALTNIWREPRREITETLIGLVPAAAVGAWIYWFAGHLQPALATGKVDKVECPFVLALLLAAAITAFGLLLLFLAAIATHAAGEAICNRLEAAGLQLRPRQRR